MAEFLDVHVHHEPDEPPEIWFTDDGGRTVSITEITNAEAENGYGWEMVYRIQHDTVEKL